jgi:hypothetical protein
LQQKPPLIGALTGAPGMAFPHTQLGSGITPGRVTAALHQNGSLSGNLSGNACLRHSLFYVENLSQISEIVNPLYFPLPKKRRIGFHNVLFRKIIIIGYLIALCLPFFVPIPISCGRTKCMGAYFEHKFT